MNRSEYLSLCQKCSILPDGVQGVKQNVPDDLKVVCEGIAYYPESYMLSFKNGKAKHTAILHGLTANTRIYAKLEKVESFK